MRCLVFRPETRVRHNLKAPGFILDRIISTTAASLVPKFISMASKGVRSSQAISMMRERSSSLKSRLTFGKRKFLCWVVKTVREIWEFVSTGAKSLVGVVEVEK